MSMFAIVDVETGQEESFMVGGVDTSRFSSPEEARTAHFMGYHRNKLKYRIREYDGDTIINEDADDAASWEIPKAPPEDYEKVNKVEHCGSNRMCMDLINTPQDRTVDSNTTDWYFWDKEGVVLYGPFRGIAYAGDLRREFDKRQQ